MPYRKWSSHHLMRNLLIAGTVLAALPIFIVLLIFQRALVRGLTTGAVKG